MTQNKGKKKERKNVINDLWRGNQVRVGWGREGFLPYLQVTPDTQRGYRSFFSFFPFFLVFWREFLFPKNK
jgi:hypothetical protein